jgi:hypothetical protein
LRVLGGFEFEFFFGLPLFLPFVGFAFFFLLLDDFLELFLTFGLLVVLHLVLDSKFKLCASV